MWFSFAISVVAACALLYLPCLFLLRAIGFEWKVAFLCSPLFTVAAYSVLATAYSAAGIACTWYSVLGPVFAVGVVAWAVICFVTRHKGAHTPRFAFHPYARPHVRFHDALVIVAYAAIGIILAVYAFVMNMPAPDAVFQAYDNMFHMNVVDGFAETASMSIFGTSKYPTPEAAAINPIPSSGSLGFYPTAFHMLAAFVAQLAGVTPSLAINATCFALAGVVFPLSSLALIRQLFWRLPPAVALGAVCVLVMADFPWGFIVFGPLFSNLLALSVYPAFIFVFIASFDRESGSLPRAWKIALAAVGVVALAMSQPNAVFLAAVVLVPFCAFTLAGYLKRQPNPRLSARRSRTGIVALAIVAVVAFWLSLVFVLVFRSDLANESWGAFASDSDALVYLLTFALKVSGAQLIPAALTAVGIAYTLRRREYMWLTVAFVVMAVMYLACAALGYPWRNLLTGFWYNDGYRVAANLALTAIPLICLGAYVLFRALKRALASLEMVRAPRFQTAAAAVLACAVVLFSYYPSFEVWGIAKVKTPFAYIAEGIQVEYGTEGDAVLDSAEAEFVEKVREAVPEGALVVNQPNDGSGFIAPESGLFLYYRDGRHYGEDNETAASRAIREHLAEYADDMSVREAVEEVDARYVLLLDSLAYPAAEPGTPLFTYDADEWPGIESITDGTPGFEVVLSDGDMRLYRIIR